MWLSHSVKVNHGIPSQCEDRPSVRITPDGFQRRPECISDWNVNNLEMKHPPPWYDAQPTGREIRGYLLDWRSMSEPLRWGDGPPSSPLYSKSHYSPNLHGQRYDVNTKENKSSPPLNQHLMEDVGQLWLMHSSEVRLKQTNNATDGQSTFARALPHPEKGTRYKNNIVSIQRGVDIRLCSSPKMLQISVTQAGRVFWLEEIGSNRPKLTIATSTTDLSTSPG